MDKDLKELLSIFNAHNVRYLIIGGYAYARYAEPRTTKDLDVFVEPDPANAVAVYKALTEFGAPLQGVSISDLHHPGTVLQIGVAPLRIAILCHIDGPSFDEAWQTSEEASVDDELSARYISSDLLIANKVAAGSHKTLLTSKSCDTQRRRKSVASNEDPKSLTSTSHHPPILLRNPPQSLVADPQVLPHQLRRRSPQPLIQLEILIPV